MTTYVSAESAIAGITNVANVFVHGGAATPNVLLDALVAQSGRFHPVTLIHLHTEGPATYALP